MNSGILLLLGLILTPLFILLIRKVVLWYYKIDRIEALLEEQTGYLRKIASSTSATAATQANVKRTANEWKCPQCDTINDNSTAKCTKCGYNLQ